MKLSHWNFFTHTHGLGDEIHFFGQVLNVFRTSTMIFGDDFVASAVVANVRTKRQMEIQRNWFLMRGASFQCIDIVSLIELAIKSISGWVGCVAWPIDVKAFQQFRLKQRFRASRG